MLEVVVRGDVEEELQGRGYYYEEAHPPIHVAKEHAPSPHVTPPGPVHIPTGHEPPVIDVSPIVLPIHHAPPIHEPFPFPEKEGFLPYWVFGVVYSAMCYATKERQILLP